MKRPRVGIFGATTPAGLELMRVLSTHPMLDLAFVAEAHEAGERVIERYPGLSTNLRLAFVDDDPARAKDVDLVFCALALHEALELVPAVYTCAPDTRMVDLSPLLRSSDADLWHRMYRMRHPAPQMLADFSYGVPEHDAAVIQTSRGVAVPGALSAAAIVALAPLASRDLLRDQIFLSAMVGYTDAEISPDLRAAQGRMQAIRPLECPQALELGTWLARGADAPFELQIVPVVAPEPRGVYLTAFIPLPPDLALESVNHLYTQAYANTTFVRLLTRPPALVDVLHSNRAHVFVRASGQTLAITAALDNLGKGSAMNAVACANLMLGLPEEAGLLFCGLSA